MYIHVVIAERKIAARTSFRKGGPNFCKRKLERFTPDQMFRDKNLTTQQHDRDGCARHFIAYTCPREARACVCICASIACATVLFILSFYL